MLQQELLDPLLSDDIEEELEEDELELRQWGDPEVGIAPKHPLNTSVE